MLTHLFCTMELNEYYHYQHLTDEENEALKKLRNSLVHKTKWVVEPEF